MLLMHYFNYKSSSYVFIIQDLIVNDCIFNLKVQGKNRRCHKMSVPELTAYGACLHPIVSIRDMFRGTTRLSPPEDTVDEKLSHGKTGDVLTVLWKNRRCPQFCKCDISGSSLEPFIYYDISYCYHLSHYQFLVIL